MKKVVLAMSGGVDSSVSAFLLKEQGYEVHGFFMNCHGEKNYWPSSIDWKREERDVRKICKILGIDDLFILDCEEGYERKVISKMFSDYRKGLTPNPDILCNNVGKFPGLLKRARGLGAEFIATGHYARVRKRGNCFELIEGRDKSKDQSYFLCGLGQKYLRRVLFPVGNLTKEEVRSIARKENFPNWDKRGSRGICYLGKIDVKKFLRGRIKKSEGKVLFVDGKVIGFHPGSAFFTIGERVRENKGFVLKSDWRRENSGKKLFVARKEKGNRVVVAFEGDAALKRKRVRVVRFRKVCESEDVFASKFSARIRHLGRKYRGRMKRSDGKLFFEFERGVEGVAPGQFLVLYSGERLVGCGEIRWR